MTCAHAYVDCTLATGATSLGITFAYETPSSPKGTIVFFSGGDGTSPIGTSSDPGATIQRYAIDYYNAHYQVVQTAWDAEWEDPTGTNSGGNIGYAACRPATFLSWVNSTFYVPIHQADSSAGMCLQAESAGSGAGAYSLAWYGAGSGTGSGYNYLDKLSISAGPPFSDIKAGCAESGGESPLVEVCPAGQLGCNPTNSPSSWSVLLRYGTGPVFDINDWSGIRIPGCAGSPNSNAEDNQDWKEMSIADGTIGTFNYPKTNITSWLCSSVVSPQVMNESSPEGQLLLQNFTSSSQIPKGLTINGVSNCPYPEYVGSGTPPLNYVNLGFTTGSSAIEYDMVTDPVNKCVSHH